MEKLPMDIILLITPHLGAFDLYHFLTAYHCQGLYHDLRPRVFNSHQDSTVALYHAIRMGRLDLMEEIPNIRQLIAAIDTCTCHTGSRRGTGRHFTRKQREFAASNFGGYINLLTVAIIQRQESPNSNFEILRFLLKNGADPSEQDLFRGQSPLFIAANSGDLNAVSLLLDFNANQFICSFGNQLLQQDGFLSESHKQRQTLLPLEAAVRGGHLRIVKLLIDQGGFLLSCPFNLVDLKTRRPSPELMEIFQNLHNCAVYRMNQSQLFRIFTWAHPTVNRKSRQSSRIQKRTKNRRDRVNSQLQKQFDEFLSLFNRPPVPLSH